MQFAFTSTPCIKKGYDDDDDDDDDDGDESSAACLGPVYKHERVRPGMIGSSPGICSYPVCMVLSQD